MKKAILIAMALATAATCHAQTSRDLLNLQGQLTDTDGVPINDTVALQISIYDHATATADANLHFRETQSVPVTNGIYNVLMGAGTITKGEGASGGIHENVFTNDNLWVGMKVSADPEMTPRMRLTSGAFAFRARTAVSATTAPIPHYITGLELEWVTNTTIRVTPGAADVAGAILNATAYSPDINVTNAANWAQGTYDTNIWAYVYLYNDSGSIGYKLSDEPPDLADHNGNTAGTKRYQEYAALSYRCVGAVRVEQDGALRKFYQIGDWVYYDKRHQAFSGGTGGSWQDLDCSPYVPRISQLIRLHAYASNGNDGKIRVKGSTDPSGVVQVFSNIGSQEYSINTDSAQFVQITKVESPLSIYTTAYYVGDMR